MDRALRLLLRLAFSQEGRFLCERIFQNKSGKFGEGFHSPRNLGQSQRKVKPSRCRERP